MHLKCRARRLLGTWYLLALLMVGVVAALPAWANSTNDDLNWSAKRIGELVQSLAPSTLKDTLMGCLSDEAVPRPSRFSIGHRGAPLRYAEHTRESYEAAAGQGAGVIECDVTFTKDRQLVCRHSQCDLHRTTNILRTPLAKTCRKPFSPAGANGNASAQCCTSEITVDEFLSLKGRSDNVNRKARTVDEYLHRVNKAGGNRHTEDATLMTHRQSIQLFQKLGVLMVPELKVPQVAMPFDGDYSRQQYARQLIQDYRDANVPATQVWAQSFHLQDVLTWLKDFPEYGRQAVLLDGRYRGANRINPLDPQTFVPSMQDLASRGVQTIAPPMWMLLTTRGDNIVASPYVAAARDAGLNIVTWTLERSGSLTTGGGWYYQSVRPQVSQQADMLRVLGALHQQADVRAVFSDWPATTSFYANCLGVK